MNKNNLDEDENNEKTRFILQRYRDRLKVLRLGKEYAQKDDIPNAVKAYIKYLQALADYYGVEEKNLKPSVFKGQNSVVEILMVSQVYWDLSKSYDRAPKLAGECQRCLNQFILFSVGFKFQYLNSEILRKYIKRRVAHNSKLFEDAYKQMRDESKRCYIATYCYNENHPIVIDLRKFKQILIKYRVGIRFVDLYYYFSIRLINLMKSSPYTDYLFRKICRPILFIFSSSLKIVKIIK